MPSLFAHATPVDATGDTQWTRAHTVRLAVVRVDDRMRHHVLWDIQSTATWALLSRDQFGNTHLMATNADPVGNLVNLARAVALEAGIDFAEPPTCRYCGLPVAAGAKFCPGTDCWLLDGRVESTWRDDYPHSDSIAMADGGWSV